MKKLILLTAFAVTTSISMAQVSFGAQLGANIGMGKLKSYDTDPLLATFTNKPSVGFMGGFVAEIPFAGKLAFRPELNFIQKGGKTLLTSGNTSGADFKRTLNYIQLPLDVVYKLSVGSGSVFFGLGPEFAFGISGKDKVSGSSDPSVNKSYTVKFDGKKSDDYTSQSDADKDHLKSFDIGANIIAGYKLGMGVFFKLGYTLGFAETDPNKSNKAAADQTSYKNRGFNICVGYMLGGSKSSKKDKD